MKPTRHHLWPRLLLAITLTVMSSACGPRQPAAEEGVYTTAREIFFYQAEVLELKRGRFRYWFQSDVVPLTPPKLPITGKYRREGDRIKLEMKPGMDRTLLLVNVSGAMCLVREDSVPFWESPRREVYRYGWIIRVSHPVEQMWPGEKADHTQWDAVIPRLPTLRSLKLKIQEESYWKPSPVAPDGAVDPALRDALNRLPK